MTNLQQIQARVAQVLATAEKMFNVDLSGVNTRYDLKGCAAGMAIMNRKRTGIAEISKTFSMRFNMTMINNDSFDHVLNETIPHEIAHIVCMMKGSDNGHGANWRRACIALGGSGKTYHSEDVIYATGKTWEYTASNGETVRMSGQRHTKIQRGVSYRLKRGGVVDKTCAFELVGVSGREVARKPPTAPQAAPVAQPKTTKPKAKGRVTNADKIRAAIARAKDRGYARDVVVDFGVEELGMTRSLARKYTNENWSKV